MRNHGKLGKKRDVQLHNHLLLFLVEFYIPLDLEGKLREMVHIKGMNLLESQCSKTVLFAAYILCGGYDV